MSKVVTDQSAGYPHASTEEVVEQLEIILAAARSETDGKHTDLKTKMSSVIYRFPTSVADTGS